MIPVLAAHWRLAWSLALPLALVLTGCASPEPAPRDRFYSLGAPATPAASRTPLSATLLVNNLAARGFLGGRQIVFRTEEEPLRVQRYPTVLWEEPPGRALAARLVDALRAAGLYRFVLSPEQRVRGDYVLGGELTRFEHRPTAVPPRVTADLTLTLMRSGDRRSMLAKRYAGEEPAAASTPEEMVRAFQRLADRLVAEAVADLTRLRPHLRAPGGV
jgi:cholesterol transport system auxiliary component